MLNFRILSAWPNWFTIPIMLVIWLMVGALAAQAFGAQPYHTES